MLTQRQRAAAKALFEGLLTETQILKQYRLSPTTWQQWLQTEEFKQELQEHCQSAIRETCFIITRYGPIAALKLAELLGSDKPDVARRAALDLIDRCLNQTPDKNQDDQELSKRNMLRLEPQSDRPEFSDEQARRMLLALAEGLNSEK